MADLRQALAELGDDAERVEVAMVTVDPARDTDVLTEYVQSFVADGHAIATDDQAALQSVAGPFGVSYEVVTAPDGSVEVGHTSFLFGVDDTGTLVLSRGRSARRPTTSPPTSANSSTELRRRALRRSCVPRRGQPGGVAVDGRRRARRPCPGRCRRRRPGRPHRLRVECRRR